jgi:SAM-dependent methyltransferase
LKQDAYREHFEMEDSHWWFEGRRAVIWALLRRVGTVPGVRILDAGCGTGRNLIEFCALGTVQGVDASPAAIEFCRERGLDVAREGRIESLPFADDSFDLILATDVLEHLDDDRAALLELRRVSVPGGRLLATVPAYQWLWSEHDVALHHHRRYTMPAFHERMRSAGWEPVVSSYFNTVLLGPIAAVRLLARARPASDDSRVDFRMTPRSLNRFLSAPMRAEAALIGRGVSLPAGVSIGVVCTAASG